MMGQIIRMYRILRWAMLAGLVISVFLLLRSPGPVAPTLDPSQVKSNAESFQQKLAELERARLSNESDEVRFTAAEVNAAIAESSVPQPALEVDRSSQTAASDPPIPIKSTQVSFEDDLVKGQFVAQVHGRDLYITVAGRLGSHDGYATFDPTEFKVGDLSVPVSLVNPALQRKLAEPENRDKLKLPDFVKGLRVEDGELVITQ